MLIFQNPSKSYSINTRFYDYKKISDIDIIFIGYDETQHLSELENEAFLNQEEDTINYNKIKHLIEKERLTFGVKFTNYPFYKFVFCKKNEKNIICFDNIMESYATFNSYINKNNYDENLFYPNCNK